MLFVIKNLTKSNNRDWLRSKIYELATNYISSVNFNSTEVALDNYLRHEYDYGLRRCCQAIINSIDISIDTEKDFIITIKDPNLDNLAGFITYGNGYLSGSNILRNAFDIE